MTKIVSPIVATLLWEKEFKEPTKLCYDGDDNPLPFNAGNDLYTNDLEYTAAPTISEVLEWLRINYNVWIAVDIVILGSDEWEYDYTITYLPKEYENEKRRSPHLRKIISFISGSGIYNGAWRTPSEAYEKAIIYILKYLI